MGYNSNCYDQDCYYNCCNSAGYCPASSSGCYYYYHEKNDAATIAGAVIGAVLGVILIIILIRYCYNKRQEQKRIQELRRQNLMNPQQNTQGTTIVIPGYGQPLNPMYGRPLDNNPMNVSYGQPVNPAYGQPANPPYYGQPAMGQPINHPVIVN